LPWAAIGRALGAFSLAPKGRPKVVTAAALSLKPLLGCQSYNLPTLTDSEYIYLVDYTGRQVYPGKCGVIKESEPQAINKLGLNPEHWAHRVQGFAEGIGAKWFRVIGELEDMIEKAIKINHERCLAFGEGLS